jgi:outer membrane receptor protein involved in Fe transport
VRREEDGDLTCADNTADFGACNDGGSGLGVTGIYDARQSGWYAQGVYQFHPQWRVGYRYDRLDVGSVDFSGAISAALSKPDFTPKRQSLMLDYNPSEYSRLRLQFARDEAEQGLKDNQVTLQYIHSLGPHGAHKF